MNAERGDKLKLPAEAGDIELLYAVIQDDPSILENIDKNQFIETPLHIAASRGHLEFAIEIMNLKPSFATKLNLQGYSPIHLAMDRDIHTMVRDIHLAMASPIHLVKDRPNHHSMDARQTEMVSNLVDINKDVVRVKGRRGLTPFHFACQIGEVELIRKFLTACPDSIEDVNVSRESALHIAVNNKQFEALQVLVGWLKENFQRGARKLEEKILNHKDKAGNTILHISALSNDSQLLQFLVKTGIKLNAKNSQNKTALDLASTPEMQSILRHVKAKHGSEMKKLPTRAEEPWKIFRFINYLIISMRRIRRNISEEQRNIWSIVVTLVATATYESVLNPPGGVFQVSASDDNNMKIKSTDLYYSTRGNAGKSILSKNSFAVFSSANLISFFMSTIVMVILTPTEPLGRLLFGTVQWFGICYLTALLAISPTHANTTILYILISFIAYIVLLFRTVFYYFDRQQSKKSIVPDIIYFLRGDGEAYYFK